MKQQQITRRPKPTEDTGPAGAPTVNTTIARTWFGGE